MSDSIKSVVPYTTRTGVQIGIMYRQKPEYEQDIDAYALQLALLKVYREPSLIQRFLRFI
jgi:hypothetical protein